LVLITILSAVVSLGRTDYSRAGIHLPDQPKDTEAMPADEFKNPIISGTWADPGFIRVADDYYSVCSTQGWQPGAFVIHSRDMLHWEYIGHAYREHPEIPPGKTNRGCWGLDIGYNPNNKTFIIYAPLSNGTLYAYYSKDPAGPYDVRQMGRLGTDPGFFADDDGKLYLICSEKAVIWELSRDGLSIMRDVAKIDKTGIRIFEGPAIFKRQGYYYLLYSANGTAPHEGGMIGTMRATRLEGPWEHDPNNPQLLTDPEAPIQGPQHGTLLETQNGQWFLAYHAHELSHFSLARQTYLEPVEWTKDGWWKCSNGKVPSRANKKPLLPEYILELAQSDEFSRPELGLQWFFLTKPDFSGESWSLTDKAGYLTINTKPGDISSVDSQVNIFQQRVINKKFEFTTEVSFDAAADREAAGLHLFHDPQMNLWLTTSADNRRKIIEVGKYNNGRRTNIYSVENDFGNTVYLKIAVDGNETATFYYGADSKKWNRIGTDVYFGDSFQDLRSGNKGDPDLGWIGVDGRNKWTGTTFGIFAVGGDNRNPNPAQFNYFRVTSFDDRNSFNR